MTPRAAIIVPAYNAEDTLGLALRSVQVQTEQNFEVVVVDDGSTDGTAKLARELCDPRIRVVSQSNQGLPAARNAGIRASSAELISLLDADDALLPTYLHEVAATAERFPRAGFIFTDAWVLQDGTMRIGRKTVMRSMRPPRDDFLSAERLLSELLERNFVFVGATLRRQAVEAAGPFRESLWSAEDWEMWLRLAANGFGAALCPGPLALYRRRPGQMSANRERMLAAVSEVYRLVCEEYGIAEHHRRRASALRTAIEKDRVIESRSGSPSPRSFDPVRRRAGRFRHWRLVAPTAVRRLLRDIG